jgi:outer membrane protein OmpA-like peptidoglycan-associated protein
LPVIRFANGSDRLDDAGRTAVLTAAWAASRWNAPTLGVPGFPAPTATPPKHPRLAQRRAAAIATLLQGQGVTPAPAPSSGRAFRLVPSEIAAP